MILDPLGAYRFMVSLAPADTHISASQAVLAPAMGLAGFSEVGGLSGELEVTTHPEGGLNDFVHQLPVRHSWSRISLKRGITYDMSLWLWYQAGLYQSLGARRDGVITLMTPDGIPAMAWLFEAGLAVKWEGPQLNSNQSSIAIEGIEIAHHGIIQIPLVPPI